MKTKLKRDNNERKKGFLDLYSQIPSFICIPDCTDCCGPVPFAKSEWNRVKDKRQGGASLMCPYISPNGGGCEIYKQRPFICRLFGTSFFPPLRCPHGRGPLKMLSENKARQLTREYHNRIDE